MRYCILFSLVLCAGSSCYAQLKRDSILLYERTMDRRLTLYRGQLRINASYYVSLFNKRFTNDGSTVKLSEEGIAKTRYSALLELKYGINNFITLNALLTQENENQRGPDITIVDPPNTFLIHYETETKGLNDPVISLDLRAPLRTNKIDLVGTIGATLPIASSRSEQPEYGFEYDYYGTDFNRITYQYKEHWGNNAAVMIAGLRGKLRGEDWALTGLMEYRHALKVSEGRGWNAQVYNEEFEYNPYSYNYQIPDKLYVGAEAEYQALPWVDTFIGVDYRTASKGWSEKTFQKVAVADSKLISVRFGLEILITHKLWLRQSFGVSPWGQSEFGPFTIYTTVNYNLFL